MENDSTLAISHGNISSISLLTGSSALETIVSFLLFQRMSKDLIKIICNLLHRQITGNLCKNEQWILASISSRRIQRFLRLFFPQRAIYALSMSRRIPTSSRHEESCRCRIFARGFRDATRHVTLIARRGCKSAVHTCKMHRGAFLIAGGLPHPLSKRARNRDSFFPIEHKHLIDILVCFPTTRTHSNTVVRKKIVTKKNLLSFRKRKKY